MTPEQAAAALKARGRARSRWPGGPTNPVVRSRLMSLAQSDARTVLAQMHPDEYRVLYEAALAQRFAEAEEPAG